MASVRVPLAARSVRYVLVVAVAAVVLVGSVLKPDTTAAPTMGPFGVFGADKWTHALAYAGLAATLAYASVDTEHAAGRLVLAVVLAVGFGIGVEFVQWPIPYRTASVADALANAIGASLLALGWWGFTRFVRFVPVARWRESVP